MTKDNITSVETFYNKIAADYDKQYETPYWNLYHEITWNNIKRFLPKNKKVLILDAGGGTGYWAIKMAKLGHNVVLTDISKNILEVAQEKIKKENLENRIRIQKTDIKDMSCFPSDRFDMALAEGDPVSYSLNPEKSIGELARITKPKGYIIVSVDNKYPRILKLLEENSFEDLSKFIKTGAAKREFKFQTFSPEELKNLFENCGLKTIKIIGKPILVQSIDKEKRDNLIKNNFKKILELELKFCDVPSIIGLGGHLEIVGVKK